MAKINVSWYEIYHYMSNVVLKTAKTKCLSEESAVNDFKDFNEMISSCSSPEGGIVLNFEDSWKRIPIIFLSESIITLNFGIIDDMNDL